MKKVFYLSFFFLFASQVFGQKNQISLYYNQNLNEEFSKLGAIGGRYSREVFPRLSLAVGADYENYYYPLNQTSRLSVYSLATGEILFEKAAIIDYPGTVKTFTFDALLYYNLLGKSSKFTLSPFIGVSQRVFQVSNIPYVEILNYEVINREETKETKYFTFPKAGLAFSYNFWKRFSIGTELYYREYLGDKSTILATRTSKSTSVGGTTIYDDQGRSTVLTDGNGSGGSVYQFYEQVGFSLALTYRF